MGVVPNHPWAEAPPSPPGPPRRPRRAGLVIGVAVAVVLLGAAAIVAVTLAAGPQTPPLPTVAAAATPTATVALPAVTPASAPATGVAVAPTTPAASPTATATATAALPPPPPGLPGTPIDLTAVARQVSELRGLAFLRPVATLSVSAEELAARLDAIGFTDLGDPDVLAARASALTLLRLLPPDTDLAALLRGLYAEQVLGLYVPDDQALYVRRAGEDASVISAYQRVTAAHELTHALQDQHWGLEALRDLPDDAVDADTAALALIEGDAVVLQQRWQELHQSADDQQSAAAEVASNPSAVLDSAPRAFQDALFFPYVQGTAFARALLRDGGQTLLDSAFDDPPSSTEQVLHPIAYTVRDQPVAALPTGHPGAGWTPGLDEEFGELDLLSVLSPLGDARARDAATGWGGGRLRTWGGGAGSAIAVALAFDTVEDAAQACEAVPAWYATAAQAVPAAEPGAFLAAAGDSLTLACNGDRVTFALAPDVPTARALSG